MSFRHFLGLAAIAVLAGCAAAVKPLTQNILQTEESWAASQRQQNVQAIVQKDEEYSTLTLSNQEVIAGAGPAEKTFRRVELMMVHSEGGKPFLNYKGIKRFAAIVPDGFPLLKWGDIVEVRYEGIYDRLKGFAHTKQGTAVLRVLCPGDPDRAKMPAFKACAKELNWHRPWGEDARYFDGIAAANSGRPYAAKLTDHTELSFTPYYDADGKPLATAVPPAPRPDITSWPAPRKY
jgi:hypothetical protein